MTDTQEQNTSVAHESETTQVENIEEVKTTPNQTTQSDDSSSEEDRYSAGEVLKFVRVRFPGNSKSFPFIVGKRKFSYGQKVVAMSDRGMTVGYINSFPYEIKFDKSMLPIRSISKVAEAEDIRVQKENIEKEVDAERKCIRLIDKFKLDMNLTHVEFMQFGKKAVFYFTAPARVDFRDLVKELVSDLKIRIELRQISVRDRAAAIGAVGPCGLQTCCSSFLKNYGNVSIKMAKNQNMALIPSKLNGVCGQIKCCIRYEDDVYSEKRKNLPVIGNFIKVANGDIGKVTKIHIIIEQFDMLTEKGQIRRYSVNQYDKKDSQAPSGWKFPSEFKHIVNETKDVIGLEKEELVPSQHYENWNSNESESESEDITEINEVENHVNKAKQETAPKQVKSQSQDTDKKQSDRPRRPNNKKNFSRNRNRNKNQKTQNKDQNTKGDKGAGSTNEANNKGPKQVRDNKKPRPKYAKGPRKNGPKNDGPKNNNKSKDGANKNLKKDS